MECLGRRPAPSAPLEASLHGVDAGAQRGRRDAVRGFAHKDPICAAGSESFVSVEVAGSNGPRQKVHGDAHCPWLTGFFFPASGVYGPSATLCVFSYTRRRSSPFRAAGLPSAPRNPRGSCPARAGRKSKDAPPRTRTACPAPGFPREVQAGSHRLAQVFHGVLLAPASSVGDDSPGRRSATARRLPERPHACCGCGEEAWLAGIEPASSVGFEAAYFPASRVSAARVAAPQDGCTTIMLSPHEMGSRAGLEPASTRTSPSRPSAREITHSRQSTSRGVEPLRPGRLPLA